MATVLYADDDWVTMRIKFHHEDEAFFIALGLGRRAQIVSPAKLKERVQTEVAAMAVMSSV